MALHTLDLLANAVDSFNEALDKYNEGNAGKPRAYKFAILHFSHFLELLFKYYVSEAHPLLIYKNPFSKRIEKENTIGLWEAVQFLKNEGKEIDEDFYTDLEWLKKIRNNIEHYKFEMDTPEVRKTLGRLTQSLIEFNELFTEFELEVHVETKNLKIFEELADEYKADITNAKIEAKEASVDKEGHYCYYCDNSESAAFTGEHYICMYCGEEDTIIDCCICGDRLRQSEGITWNADDPDMIDYICESCESRYS